MQLVAVQKVRGSLVEVRKLRGSLVARHSEEWGGSGVVMGSVAVGWQWGGLSQNGYGTGNARKEVRITEVARPSRLGQVA
eukprot:1456868-Heterocapsa_arctica.AAC.1